MMILYYFISFKVKGNIIRKMKRHNTCTKTRKHGKRHCQRGSGMFSRFKKSDVSLSSNKTGFLGLGKLFKTAKGQSSTRAKLGKKGTLNFITRSGIDGTKTARNFKLSDTQSDELKGLKSGITSASGRKAKKIARGKMKTHLAELQHDLETGNMAGAKKLSDTIYGKKKWLGSIRGRTKNSHITFKQADGKDVMNVVKTSKGGITLTSKHTYKDGILTGVKKTVADTNKFGSSLGRGSRTMHSKYNADGTLQKLTKSRGPLSRNRRSTFSYKRGSNGSLIRNSAGNPILLRAKQGSSSYTIMERETALKEFKNHDGSIDVAKFNAALSGKTPYQQRRLKEMYAQEKMLTNPGSYVEHRIGQTKPFKGKQKLSNTFTQEKNRINTIHNLQAKQSKLEQIAILRTGDQTAIGNERVRLQEIIQKRVNARAVPGISQEEILKRQTEIANAERELSVFNGLSQQPNFNSHLVNAQRDVSAAHKAVNAGIMPTAAATQQPLFRRHQPQQQQLLQQQYRQPFTTAA